MRHRILIATTNHDTFSPTNQKTGAWLSDITHAYEVFEEAKLTIDLISPEGGETAIDPRSLNLKDRTNKRCMEDSLFRSKLHHTLLPHRVRVDEYDAIYFAGGHGAMWDFPDHTTLQQMTARLYETGKIVGTVGHGVAALLNVQLTGGTFLLDNRRLTGFSNLEERLSRHGQTLPFSIEDALKQKNVLYKRHLIPFLPYVVTGERLISGQNSSSARGVAKAITHALRALGS